MCTFWSYYDNTNNICEECSFSIKNIFVKCSEECVDKCNNNYYLQMKNNQLYFSDTCE